MRFETYEYLDIEYNSYGAHLSDDGTYMILVAQKTDVQPGDGISITGHADDGKDYQIYGLVTDVHDFDDGMSEYIVSVEVIYEVMNG